MDVAFMVVFLVVFGGGMAAFAVHSRKRWKQALGDAGRQLGLVVEEATFWKSSRATGVIGGRYPATIDTYTVSTGKSSQVFTRIRVGTGVARDVVFEAEGVGASFKKWFLGSDVEVGDELFDSAVVVRGDEDELLSRLTRDARLAVRDVVQRKARLKDGELVWTRSGLVSDVSLLVDTANALAHAAACLDTGDRVAAIAKNAASDPVHDFRHACLRRLIAHHPRRPETRQAVEAGLRDRSPDVRVLAASAAGPAGVPALLQIATDPGGRMEHRVVAWRGLAAGSAVIDGVGEALDPALTEVADEEAEPELRDAVLGACAVSGHDPERALLERLAPLAGPAGHIGLAKVLEGSRGALGESGEDLLLGMLAEEAPTEVIIAAAEALGAKASTRVVEALLPFTKGVTTSGAVKDAARAAISAIQGRAEGAAAGQLTVVEGAGGAPSGGELALEAAVGGALSDAEVEGEAEPRARGTEEDTGAAEIAIEVANDDEWPELAAPVPRDG
jgi:hypothetical protein